MGSLETWGAIAATLLVIECILFNLIWLGLAFGLWKGSAWLREHAQTGLAKAAEYLALGQRYARQGQSIVVSPFVRMRGRVEGWRAMRARLKG